MEGEIMANEAAQISKKKKRRIEGTWKQFGDMERTGVPRTKGKYPKKGRDWKRKKGSKGLSGGA